MRKREYPLRPVTPSCYWISPPDGEVTQTRTTEVFRVAEPPEPHFGIMNRLLLDPLAANLKAGFRKGGAYFATEDAAPGPWPGDLCLSINTPDRLARAETLASQLDRLP